MRSEAGWMEFRGPIETRSATTLDEVVPILEWAEAQAQSRFVVGFVSYDAAPAFDDFQVVPGNSAPLARFATYERQEPFEFLTHGSLADFGSGLKVAIPKYAYFRDIKRIKAMLRQGRTYQVNHTFRLEGELQGDPGDMFCALCEDHVPEHGALLVYDDLTILSLSPELFFRRNGHLVTTQPMKGTRPISLAPDELASSEKDHAENLMIVDMIRNDLGRVAQVGSVQAPILFEVAAHGSVWQMTSTITAHVTHSTASLFRALFPCASVVGAPKIETTRAIAELEHTPRGVYCGAIGWMGPEKKAYFNVAIRTLVLQDGRAEYGVGGGIVWDSDPLEEWEECHSKMRALDPLAPCQVLETAIWNGDQVSFAEARLGRMRATAAHCGFVAPKWEPKDFGQPPLLVRLKCGVEGQLGTEVARVSAFPDQLTYRPCPWPVDSCAPKLGYKSTRRALFDRARRCCPDVDETLLWNERGEVTEFTTGNVVAKLDGVRVTPPESAGLLPGLARANAIAKGLVHVQAITRHELARAEEVWHVNSVRGWTRAFLVS
ncbi:MAG: chorismate-binding protein [Fimbriimonadaceae bacterium]|nr:chorismate-binding protein [Fimbriimonadaceae bacterium]